MELEETLDDQEKACPYDGCGKTFSKPSRLRQHLCVHTGERAYKCDVDGCGKTYTRQAHLKRHLQTSHSSEPKKAEQYWCTHEKCESVFESKHALAKHVKRKHETSYAYKCYEEGCGQTFRKRHLLRTHQIEHGGQTLFQYRCKHEGCEMTFKKKSHLERHGKVHMGYTCDLGDCKEHFATWSMLRRHKATAHKKQAKCPVCEKTFSRSEWLTAHMKIHREFRETFPCPFENCERSYYEMRNLNAHVKSYHKGVKFECDVIGCEKKFCSKRKCADHKLLHTKNLPHKEIMTKTKPKPKREPKDKKQLKESSTTFAKPRAMSLKSESDVTDFEIAQSTDSEMDVPLPRERSPVRESGNYLRAWATTRKMKDRLSPIDVRIGDEGLSDKRTTTRVETVTSASGCDKDIGTSIAQSNETPIAEQTAGPDSKVMFTKPSQYVSSMYELQMRLSGLKRSHQTSESESCISASEFEYGVSDSKQRKVSISAEPTTIGDSDIDFVPSDAFERENYTSDGKVIDIQIKSDSKESDVDSGETIRCELSGESDREHTQISSECETNSKTSELRLEKGSAEIVANSVQTGMNSAQSGMNNPQSKTYDVQCETKSSHNENDGVQIKTNFQNDSESTSVAYTGLRTKNVDNCASASDSDVRIISGSDSENDVKCKHEIVKVADIATISSICALPQRKDCNSEVKLNTRIDRITNTDALKTVTPASEKSPEICERSNKSISSIATVSCVPKSSISDITVNDTTSYTIPETSNYSITPTDNTTRVHGKSYSDTVTNENTSHTIPEACNYSITPMEFTRLNDTSDSNILTNETTAHTIPEISNYSITPIECTSRVPDSSDSNIVTNNSTSQGVGETHNSSLTDSSQNKVQSSSKSPGIKRNNPSKSILSIIDSIVSRTKKSRSRSNTVDKPQPSAPS